MEEQDSPLQILTPCSSDRREYNNSNSPEFEFWMIRNPSFPQPNLLSADELFSDGFLLPLHNLNLSNDPPPDHVAEPDSSAEPLSASPRVNRWMDIFKKRSRSSTSVINADGNGKEKRRGKNFVSPSNGFGGSELNINIWPFSRSRSAGNQATRPRPSAAGRKVSSAPCSRSNSAGESKSRKLPSSPCRAASGVQLGRSSPVWQVRRRGGSGGGVSVSARKTPAAGSVGGGRAKARVLSSNVPMCVGYRHHTRCKSDDNSTHGVTAATGGGGGGSAGEGVRGNNLFNIRSLFTKKVH